MSGFKLVEAEVSTNNNRRSRRGSGNRNQYYNEYSQPLTETDRNYFAHVALTELELLFHIENLATDMYIRSYMDEDGYRPYSLLLAYPSIIYSGADPNDLWFLLLKVQSEQETYFLEIDEARSLLRLKSDYEKWLLPNVNSTSGRGLPRYPQMDQQLNNNDDTTTNNNDDTTTNNVETETSEKLTNEL
jgi:la-related protein 1